MRDYSQKFVAGKLGMSQNAYSKIENNVTQLSVHHIKELAKIFEVSVTDLLKDDFDIYRHIQTPSVVTKADLLASIDRLKTLLEGKQALKHDAYLVGMSHVLAAENAVASAN